MSKQFKVVAVSTNTNSFGLRGMVLMAKDGEAWQVGANDINIKKKGDIVTLEMDSVDVIFANLGFEIPVKLLNAPESVINEVWGPT